MYDITKQQWNLIVPPAASFLPAARVNAAVWVTQQSVIVYSGGPAADGTGDLGIVIIYAGGRLVNSEYIVRINILYCYD